MSVRSEIPLLSHMLEQAFGRRGWHGPTLSACIRGVVPVEAAWHPGPGRNSIWELTLHAAFWKHMVRQRITGGRERFPRTPANFPSVPKKPSPAAWSADVALLKSEHRLLAEAVASFPPSRLRAKVGGTRFIPLEQIAGIAAHDAYHAGQISLIRRLYAAR